MDQARLRPAQVGASTAAAVGGAFMATRLGVYGTIIGVGLITLMSTVGTEMLLRSLERTKQAARLANSRQRGMDAPHAADAPTETLEPAATTDQLPVVETADTRDMAELPEATPAGGAGTEQATLAFPEPAPGTGDQPPSARRWPLVAGGFLASFGLALAVIVGIETFTGRSLDGDGSPTVVTVFRGAGQNTDDEPSGPPTPSGDPTAPATEEDGISGNTGEDTSSQQDSQDSPAPSDGDEPQPRDEQTPAPDEVPPSPDEEETPLPDEGSTAPPDEEETTPPQNEPTSEP